MIRPKGDQIVTFLMVFSKCKHNSLIVPYQSRKPHQSSFFYVCAIRNDKNPFIRLLILHVQTFDYTFALVAEMRILLKKLSVCQHICYEIFVINPRQAHCFYNLIGLIILYRIQ